MIPAHSVASTANTPAAITSKATTDEARKKPQRPAPPAASILASTVAPAICAITSPVTAQTDARWMFEELEDEASPTLTPQSGRTSSLPLYNCGATSDVAFSNVFHPDQLHRRAQPFCAHDSMRLEVAWAEYRNGNTAGRFVRVQGGHYSVDIVERRSASVYWTSPPQSVIRGLWLLSPFLLCTFLLLRLYTSPYSFG